MATSDTKKKKSSSRKKTSPRPSTRTRAASRRIVDPGPPPIDHPAIERRRSKLHGWGVFALEPINKNKRIIDYAGELITNKQSVNREDRYLRKGCIWVFRVNRNYSRDANVDGNVARFINHSCTPNCWVGVVEKTIWIRAARNIRRGEELTYDYNTEGDKTIPCRCRPGCTTKL